jgi:hypothetical protein
MAKSQHLLPAIHPGEILRADFMEPLRLSMNRLALDLRVPVTRIAEIAHARRRMKWSFSGIPPLNASPRIRESVCPEGDGALAAGVW